MRDRADFSTPWPMAERVANIAADPTTTLHLERDVTADLLTRGTVIRDPEKKAEVILRARVESWNADPDEARSDLDHRVETTPLVRLDLES